jgi:hypothetical protein
MAEHSLPPRGAHASIAAPSDEDHPTWEVSDSIDVARACLAGWHKVPVSMSVPVALENTFRVGFPLAAHALNCVQVAVDCWDRFPWVAAGNARIGFEHAFVAQWAYLTPAGPEHFVRVAAHNDLVAAKEFNEAIGGQPELTALVDTDMLSDFDAYAAREYGPGNEREWSIKRLLARFDQSGLMYGSYRALSKAVHPSTGTLGAYLDVTAEGSPQLNRSGHGTSDMSDAAQGLALAALWALNFVEKCEASYEGPGRAGEIAIPHRFPYDLAHSDRSDPESP